MSLRRQKKVKGVTIEFDDGSIEHTTFPDGTCGYYREADNCNTERNPIKEGWMEHTLNWTSSRKRAVKNGK